MRLFAIGTLRLAAACAASTVWACTAAAAGGGGGGGGGGGSGSGFAQPTNAATPSAKDFSALYQRIATEAVHEEPARFLPGNYYFKKGNEYFKHGEIPIALHCWEVAASWAQKAAQYNLGLVYFRGAQGIAADRPRGAAWLMLAAERHEPQFDASLAAARKDMSADERNRADALFASMKDPYGDDIAARRARNQFSRELRSLTGSPTGGGAAALPLKVWVVRKGTYEGAELIAQMQNEREQYFGISKGHVDVEPLQMINGAPATPRNS